MRFLLPCRCATRRIADCHFYRRVEPGARTAFEERTRTAVRSGVGTVGRATRPDPRRIEKYPDASGAAQALAAPVRESRSGSAVVEGECFGRHFDPALRERNPSSVRRPVKEGFFVASLLRMTSEVAFRHIE